MVKIERERKKSADSGETDAGKKAEGKSKRKNSETNLNSLATRTCKERTTRERENSYGKKYIYILSYPGISVEDYNDCSQQQQQKIDV